MNTGLILSKIKDKMCIKIKDILSVDPWVNEHVHKRRSHERIGSEYGGWVIPANYLSEGSICYCVGAGEDISFDLGIIEKYSCEVFVFDPTLRAVEHVTQVKERILSGENMPINNNPSIFYRLTSAKIDKLHFFNIGIWDEEGMVKFFAPKNSQHVSHSILNLQKTDSYFEGKVNRLSNIMKELRHKRIDLLKLDIEGAEYKVIDSIIEDNLEVDIICVEFDEINNNIDSLYPSRIRKSIKDLVKFGYLIVFVEEGRKYTFAKKEKYLSWK